jgi:hypothetical protein
MTTTLAQRHVPLTSTRARACTAPLQLAHTEDIDKQSAQRASCGAEDLSIC